MLITIPTSDFRYREFISGNSNKMKWMHGLSSSMFFIGVDRSIS